MNKKRILGTVILVVLIVILFLIIKNANQSPYDYLKNKKNSSKAERATELLYQEEIGNNKYTVFYVNENGSVSCAIIKKAYFTYTILNISSEIFIASETEPVEFHFSAYNKGKNWIYWGIIRDDDIRQVLIDKKEANIVDTAYSFRISYIMGTEKVESTLPEYELIY